MPYVEKMVFCTLTMINFFNWIKLHYVLNPIQDGGWEGEAKKNPTSFSPVTSRKVRISPKTFWLLV